MRHSVWYKVLLILLLCCLSVPVYSRNQPEETLPAITYQQEQDETLLTEAKERKEKPRRQITSNVWAAVGIGALLLLLLIIFYVLTL